MSHMTKNQLQSIFTTGFMLELGRNDPKCEVIAWRVYNNYALEGGYPWPDESRAKSDGRMFGEFLRDAEQIALRNAKRHRKAAGRAKKLR